MPSFAAARPFEVRAPTSTTPPQCQTWVLSTDRDLCSQHVRDAVCRAQAKQQVVHSNMNHKLRMQKKERNAMMSCSTICRTLGCHLSQAMGNQVRSCNLGIYEHLLK